MPNAGFISAVHLFASLAIIIELSRNAQETIRVQKESAAYAQLTHSLRTAYAQTFMGLDAQAFWAWTFESHQHKSPASLNHVLHALEEQQLCGLPSSRL